MSVAGHPGRSTAIDQLPSTLTNLATARSLISYRIRILNQNGRSAPPSSAAFVPGGSSPPVVIGFRATQKREGVILEWQKNLPEASMPDLQSVVEVLRTIQTPTSADVQAPAPAPARKSIIKPVSSPFSRQQSEDKAGEVRLRQQTGSQTSKLDRQPNGMVDRSALPRITYAYTAQRVLAVSNAGITVEMRSEPTSPRIVEIRDTFPPAPPTGLVSIPATASPSPGESLRHAAIDLSWEPNIEADLAGYLVYRTDLASETPEDAKPLRLTATPIPGSNYSDATVVSGRRYAYRVTAVDRNGNESALSLPVEDAPDGH